MRADARQWDGFAPAYFCSGARPRLVFARTDSQPPFARRYLREDHASARRGGRGLMRAYLTLTRRELASFFLSISGYVLVAGLALLVGLDFVTRLSNVGTEPVAMPITQLFFNNLLLWIIIVLTAPII